MKVPKLSQQRKELIYSLFLIILIPVCMISSTIWLTTKVKDNFDLELRRKANLANEVFGVSVANILQANTADRAAGSIQALIDQTRPLAPEIDQIGVSIQTGDTIKTISSSETQKIGQEDSSIQTQLAFAKNQSIASLIADGEGGSREWLVATPIEGGADTPIAVTVMRVSLHSSDAAVSSALNSSYIILAVMLVVIIFLLLNHFKFVEYAELFRKQKELDQMKDDFISIATHELKAPMSLIKGYISMAQEEKVSKTVGDMLTIAFNQTDRLGRLVADLLDVSRLEQGRTKFSIAELDLVSIIAPMVENYELKAREKNLNLVYSEPENLPKVAGDPDRVSEVFTNLIDNAIKYSRSGSVSISHVADTSAIITTVSDTGIGMTPDEQSRLFQRFYRARNTDTADIAGTGLGLWIIKQYIEHMGGTIQVNSEKGKGSSFIVSLPRAQSAAPAQD